MKRQENDKGSLFPTDKMLRKLNPLKEENAIKEFQCSGCVAGDYPKCFQEASEGFGCERHVCGTIASFIGKFFLGLPNGFCRLGFDDNTKVRLFRDVEHLKEFHSYDKFNVVAWKYTDSNGITFLRVYMPRLNQANIHIILSDGEQIKSFYTITKEDIDFMD